MRGAFQIALLAVSLIGLWFSFLQVVLQNKLSFLHFFLQKTIILIKRTFQPDSQMLTPSSHSFRTAFPPRTYPDSEQTIEAKPRVMSISIWSKPSRDVRFLYMDPFLACGVVSLLFFFELLVFAGAACKLSLQDTSLAVFWVLLLFIEERACS